MDIRITPEAALLAELDEAVRTLNQAHQDRGSLAGPLGVLEERMNSLKRLLGPRARAEEPAGGAAFVEIARRHFFVPRALMGRARAADGARDAESPRRRRTDVPAELERLKDNLVNAVSHELRTPLSAIMGYAEFLEDDVGGLLTPEQRGFVSEIQQGAQRLHYLIEELLDFARIDAGTFRLNVMEFDFNERLELVASLLEPRVREAGLRLERQVAASPLWLKADIERVDQVLMNLVHNAIKFTPRGGLIRLRNRREGDHLVCEIEDTGAGIASDELPRLFQRFSQLESGIRSGTGTGLGLAISQCIVAAHGGAIGVRSQPGEGSRFWFTLPLSGAG